MGSTKKKSAKRLSTSDLREALDGTIFFIDRCSGEAIGKVFESLGLSFELHDDLFGQTTPDVEWLSYCGQNDRVIISSDKKIRLNDVELSVLLSAKVAAFFFTNVDWPRDQKRKALETALPKMTNFILNERRSFIGRITWDGDVVRWYNYKGTNQLIKSRKT